MTTATFLLREDRDRAFAIRAVQLAPLGRQVRITRATRTSDQNALLHAILTDISEQLPWSGEYRDVEWYKRRCTLSWLREINAHPEVITSLDGEGFGLLIPHTSDLTTEQCASLSEWIYSFGAQNGVTFKEPNGPEPPPREDEHAP